jgi:radical SAM superfamily enzyme YgiQ (UPF0313 family)
MDSMINRYTADRKIRSDDAYTPNAEPNKRPDRAVTVYAQRCREAFPGVPVIIGSIEASLRRIAHYDYWSDKVRRSVLPDSKADLLIFGNAERAIVEWRTAWPRAKRSATSAICAAPPSWCPPAGCHPNEWEAMDSTEVDTPGPLAKHADPYAMEEPPANLLAPRRSAGRAAQPIRIVSRTERLARARSERAHTVIRLPSYEQVKDDPVLYAHASRTFHLESNPGNARALVQAHGERDVWLNPPPFR